MIGAVLLGAALVAGGIGIGYLLFGEDDDEPTAAAPVETTVAAEGEEQEPGDPPEGDPAGPTGPFGEVQATMTFNTDASAREMDRIERAWRDNPLLSGVLATSAEEMEEAMGLSVASLAAWGDAEDTDAIEDFVCGYADDPAVQLVGVGASPC